MGSLKIGFAVDEQMARKIAARDPHAPLAVGDLVIIAAQQAIASQVRKDRKDQA